MLPSSQQRCGSSAAFVSAGSAAFVPAGSASLHVIHVPHTYLSSRWGSRRWPLHTMGREEAAWADCSHPSPSHAHARIAQNAPPCLPLLLPPHTGQQVVLAARGGRCLEFPAEGGQVDFVLNRASAGQVACRKGAGQVKRNLPQAAAIVCPGARICKHTAGFAWNGCRNPVRTWILPVNVQPVRGRAEGKNVSKAPAISSCL